MSRRDRYRTRKIAKADIGQGWSYVQLLLPRNVRRRAMGMDARVRVVRNGPHNPPAQQQ
jgi:hypothetical protein